MSGLAYDALRDSVPGADPRSQPPPRTFARPSGRMVSEAQIIEVVEARRNAAKHDRRRYEGVWRLCQAFVAGNQWVGLTKARDARVVEIPNPRKRERHTANVLTRRFWDAIGKLHDDNFMPNLQFARGDQQAQRIADAAKAGFSYAWEEEVQANQRILDLLLEVCGYGTAAVRCRLDGTRGPYIGNVPVDANGRMVPIDEQNPQYQQTMQTMQAGGQVDWRTMREGRLCWDVLSPFNFLTPPGIVHAVNFPWIIVDAPMLLDDARSAYGDTAARLTEQDLSQVNLVGDRDTSTSDDQDGSGAKLRDHCLVSTLYERPTGEFPDGRTVVWSQGTLLEERPKLPYRIAGEPRAGIAFFRYHRVLRRFWGQGIIEPAIGPQRQRNRARSQHIEMKDKNLGRVYARKGSLNESNTPVGKIMEIIEVKQSADFPVETQGVPPGPWITDEKTMNDEDIDMVMGFSDVGQSESLRGVTAYAAFALQAEKEDKRVGPILSGFREGIIDLSRFTLAAMKLYWPTDKKVALSGPDNQIDVIELDATKLPDEVFFRYGKGAAAPRSQAAETQKIFDVYDRSVSSGRPLGVEWLMGSLDAGKCLPLPVTEQKLQEEKAQLENILAAQGIPPMLSPLDDHQIHIQEHRLALEQALIGNRQDLAQLLLMHIQQHEQAMASQQQLVTSVPGQQGGFGVQGGPQTQAANLAAPGA